MKRVALWVSLPLVCVVIGYPILRFLSLPDELGRQYLLSTIAQSLAAILGLGFAAVFVLTQVLSRYTPGIRPRLLTGWNLLYLVAYLIGIALPIIGLAGGRHRWVTATLLQFAGVQLNLVGATVWWSGVCLVLLPLCLLQAMSRLSPAGWLAEAKRLLDTGDGLTNDTDSEYGGATYLTVGLNALEARDVELFGDVLKQLCKAFLDACPDGRIPKEWYEFYPVAPQDRSEAILKQLRASRSHVTSID